MAARRNLWIKCTCECRWQACQSKPDSGSQIETTSTSELTPRTPISLSLFFIVCLFLTFSGHTTSLFLNLLTSYLSICVAPFGALLLSPTHELASLHSAFSWSQGRVFLKSLCQLCCVLLSTFMMISKPIFFLFVLFFSSVVIFKSLSSLCTCPFPPVFDSLMHTLIFLKSMLA